MRDELARLDRLAAGFRTDGYGASEIAVADHVAVPGGRGYSLADQAVHLRARERFEKILRGLPTMPYSECQKLKEVWRPKGRGTYGSVGPNVWLGKFIDGATEAEWERLRRQLVALCRGEDDLADRLQAANDEIYGVKLASATRVVAVLDPHRVIPIYPLYSDERWVGKLDMLRMLLDWGVLDADHVRRAEQTLRDHPRCNRHNLSSRAVVESNDLLLEILRPHFTEEDAEDTWGMRIFLYWLVERYAAWGR